MACTCVKQEAGKGKGKVKGYVTTALCDECVAQQAVDAVALEEQLQEDEAEMMIAEKTRQLAIDALTTEGKIEVKQNGKFKKK